MSTSVGEPAIGSARRPLPIHVVGDSSVCSLADRVYEAPSGDTFLFRTTYVPGLRIAELSGPGGALEPRVAAALDALVPDRSAAPPLVISAGFIDLGYVATTVSESDIELPAPLARAPNTPPICTTAAPGALNAERAFARYAAAMEPLRNALRRLRERGFVRLGVLGLSPPTRDDDSLRKAVAQAGLSYAPRANYLAFRYKATLMANAALARICADEGARFVERWSGLVAQDGLVRPDVLHDYLHLTPEAAKTSALAIAALLAEREPRLRSPNPDPNAPVPRPAENAPNGAVAVRAAAHDRVRVAPVEPRSALLHALTDASDGTRVLASGASSELLRGLRSDGADVTVLDGGRHNGAHHAAYDVALIVGDAHAPDERDRRLAALAAALRPSGTLIVHVAHGTESRARLRRRLRALFAHVVVWLTGEHDMRGSLARRIGSAEARRAPDVVAVASHRALDAGALLRRITTEPVAAAAATRIRIAEPEAPRRVPGGQRFYAEVALHNDGDAALSSFDPSPVRFVSRWLDERGNAAGDDGARAQIVPAVRPGTATRYAIPVSAPDEPGEYTLRVTLVQELVRWFAAAADVAVTVL